MRKRRPSFGARDSRLAGPVPAPSAFFATSFSSVMQLGVYVSVGDTFASEAVPGVVLDSARAHELFKQG